MPHFHHNLCKEFFTILLLMIMFGRNHSQSINPPQFSELDTESLSASYDTNEEFSPLAK